MQGSNTREYHLEINCFLFFRVNKKKTGQIITKIYI